MFYHSLSIPVATCQVREHYKGASTSSGSFYCADSSIDLRFPFTKWVVFVTGSDITTLQYVECFGSYAGRPFGIYIKDSKLFPIDDEFSFSLKPHQQYVVGVCVSSSGVVSLNINGVSYTYSLILSDALILSGFNLGSLSGGLSPFLGIIQRFSLFDSVLDASTFKRLWNRGDPVSYVLPAEFKLPGSSPRCFREYTPCNIACDLWSTTSPASAAIYTWYDSSSCLAFQGVYDAPMLSSAGGCDLSIRNTPEVVFVFEADGYLHIDPSIVWLAQPDGSSGFFDVFSDRNWVIE